jgi:hypothetical protein
MPTRDLQTKSVIWSRGHWTSHKRYDHPSGRAIVLTGRQKVKMALGGLYCFRSPEKRKTCTQPATDLSSDAWSSLDPTRRRVLAPSWAGVLRQHLLPRVPVEALGACLPQAGGCPRKACRVMLGALLLPQWHEYPDAETVAAVAFHLAWHYALDIAPLTPLYICARTVRNSRHLVREHSLAQLVLQQLTAVLMHTFAVDTSLHRIASTPERAAVRTLTR